MLWNTGENKMIDGLILSIQFLTRLPIKKPVDFSSKNLSRSILFFPLVGLIIGGLGGLIYHLFIHLNKEVASILTLLSMIILTGGLHLDGLADTCDGFLSYRERERVLEIMRDSRIGAFGLISIVVDILLKHILISSLEGNIPLILALSCGNARLVVAYLMASKKLAKKDGIGYMFHRSNLKKYALLGGGLYLLVVLVINPIYLLPLIFSFLAGELMAKISYGKIAGFTGDVYGASLEISELVSLIIFLEVLRWT